MVSPSSIPLQRRPSHRQISRPTTSRPSSRRASLIFQDPTPATNSAHSKRYSAGDSSDDEVPEPKFSASVKALLDEDGLGSSPHRRENWKEENALNRRLFTNANSRDKPSRTTSPPSQSTGSPAPRIVRIRTGSSSSRSRREGSVPSSNEKPDSDSRNPRDFITPGPRRTVRLSGSRSDAQSPPSTSSPQKRSAERRNSLEEEERAVNPDDKRPPRVRTVRLSGSRRDDQSPSSASPPPRRSEERRNSYENEHAVGSREEKSRLADDHASRAGAASSVLRSRNVSSQSEKRRNSYQNEHAVGSGEGKSRSDGEYAPRVGVASSVLRSRNGSLRAERRNSYQNEYAVGSGEEKPRFEDEYVPRVGVASSVLRSRNPEESGAHSSLRVKRVGRLTGTFLNGPARRGVLRRQSEENSDENDQAGEEARETDADANAHSEEKHAPKPSTKVSWADPSPPNVVSQDRNYESAAADGPFSRPSSPRSYESQSKSTPASSEVSSKSAGPREQPAFKVPSLPPLPSVRDQENEPPPTFKKSKPRGFNLLDKPEKLSVMYGEEKKEQPAEAPASHSPRKPLATRSNNTPHRPAPAPPKMSVLETATASGGAATASQSRRKRNQISVNGKIFTKLDCIGRGGSSRVYRVMAENYKIFALKRVSLEDLDPLTLAGYKGEIELLRKLGDLDRVVRLFDFELNHEKKLLGILMEMGESDLEKMLTYRLNADEATFDPTFTRYYWKEMLECVQAVHNHNIVHSDLKPANFLMTQGRLKLIDFGIANAIQDNTVNVHREQQVGTPNYMSPEALVDSNASIGLPASAGKMMKLGKPSDVWSLGCILYKMVYGHPPFAKITKYLERIMAIPNPNWHIPFPAYGVGGVPVPEGLIETMKACLERDQTLRPTIDQLLSRRDPFLNPDLEFKGAIPMTPEMFDKVLENVMQHCRARGVPTEDGLREVSSGFYGRLQKAWTEEKAKR